MPDRCHMPMTSPLPHTALSSRAHFSWRTLLGLHEIQRSAEAVEGLKSGALATRAGGELADPRIAQPCPAAQFPVATALTTDARAKLVDGRESRHLPHAITFVMLRNHLCENSRSYRSAMNATLALRDNVARLMNQRGWTQQTLARKSQVSQSRISYLLSYRDKQDRHPSTDTVQGIATAFGLPAWQLLCAAEERPEPELLDTELLGAAIRTAAQTFRARGALPDDASLATAAAYLYRRVQEGASLKRAAASVAEQLEQMGMNLAGVKDGPSNGERPRGSSGKGAAGKRKART